MRITGLRGVLQFFALDSAKFRHPLLHAFFIGKPRYFGRPDKAGNELPTFGFR